MITHSVYADESRQHGGKTGRFMLHGMLIVPVGTIETAFLASMFYNFYFMAISRNLKMENRYQVFTDNRNNKKGIRLSELKRQLNEYGAEKGVAGNLVSNVEPRDSKLSEPLQMVDMLLGAVGYSLEEYTTSTGKLAVVHHLENRLGLPLPGMETLKQYRNRDSSFNIWVFDFAKVRDTDGKNESRPNS